MNDTLIANNFIPPKVGETSSSENEKPEEYKMWIAIRSDLNMPAGKMAVQAGHAFQLLSVGVSKHFPDLYSNYTTDQSIVKVAVIAKNEEHLLDVHKECSDNNIPSILIKDSGRTVFDGPTYTVCAFGPSLRSELPPKLKRLQLYKDKIDE